MKNITNKILIALLCCTTLAATVGASVLALNFRDDTDGEETEQTSAQDTEKQDTTVKDETVYVLAGADGSVEKIIVSDWIKNPTGSDKITDTGSLSNVENIKGDESYTMNSENMRVWDANGKDIYSEGTSDAALPVELRLSYTLDGKSISPAALAGKSGKVTIRFDYRNTKYETVEIDGKQEKIYVPFAMLTGVLLDNDNFTNVQVSGGKLINDGNRTAVIGIAFPGLQENLGIDKEELEIPSYVEISADVENFTMTNTVTVATNEVFSSIDTDKFSDADALTESLDALTDAMSALTDGSSQLYNGLDTLLSKSSELIAGINKLADGAQALKDGAGTLYAGAGDLSEGAAALAQGLGQLSGNSEALRNGAAQVFDSLLSAATTQINAAGLSIPALTRDNYATVLDGALASLDTASVKAQAQAVALEKVTAAVNAQRDTVKAAVTEAVKNDKVTPAVTEAVRAGVQTKVLAALGMTDDTYNAGVAAGVISAEQQAAVRNAVDMQMASEEVQALINANVSDKMQSAEITAAIESETDKQVNALIEKNMNSDDVQSQINAAVEKAQAGAQSISALKGQLESYNTFYAGVIAYTEGVDTANNGAGTLSAGAGQLYGGSGELYAGISELYDGILTMKNGAPALSSGVAALKDGALQLSDGLKEFNEQGVQKLVDAVNGDLAGLVTRFKATADVSADYKSFSGLTDGMDGNVRFIYRTDAVKSAD